MQNVASKKQSMHAGCRSQRELRKQALAQGIPEFMLRLAVANKFPVRRQLRCRVIVTIKCCTI